MTMEATAVNRLIGWFLGIGSVCAGGLLLWLGSTAYELSISMARTEERLAIIQMQQSSAIAANGDTARSVRELSLRVQRLEDTIAAEGRARRAE